MKQPSLQFSVPCLNIPADENRPPTFEHLFFELPFPEFPFYVTFFLANGWANGEGRFSQQVKILKPDRSLLVGTDPQPFELKTATEPFMVVNQFENVEFTAPGTYWFEVYLGTERKLEYPLTVRQADGR